MDIIQTFLVRFQIGKTQGIFTADIIKEFFVLTVIKNEFKIFITANTVVVITFRANEKVFS